VPNRKCRGELNNLKVTMVCQGFDRSSILLQPWRRVYEISRRLVKGQVSVRLISDWTQAFGTRTQTEKVDGVEITRFGHLALAPLTRKRELIKAILESKPDVLVWFGTAGSAWYLNQLRSIEKPIIWDIENDVYTLGLFTHFSLREVVNPHHKLLLPQLSTAMCPRIIIRNVANSDMINKIVVPSRCAKTSLCGLGVREQKIRIISSGLDKDDQNFQRAHAQIQIKEAKKELGLRSEEFLVTYFGSPCTLRGVDTVILSIPKILAKIRKARFLVLSRRSLEQHSERQHLRTEENYLRNLVRRLGVEDHVEIVTGILEKSKLQKYLQASDVIALPFKIVLSEPPLSILEAMRLGKIVVTTNLESIAEIVGNGRGILIEPAHKDQLAAALLFVSQHLEEAGHWGRNAARFSVTFPNWDDIAREYATLVTSVCKGVRS
jgi:phosphatidylinositol alpha-1,6-mannosyltransferase